MFTARTTAKSPAAAMESGTLFAERTLAVLPLTHAAEVDHGVASGSVGTRHSGYGGRVDRASLAVRCKPEAADVAASLQNIRQRRCTRQQHTAITCIAFTILLNPMLLLLFDTHKAAE